MFSDILTNINWIDILIVVCAIRIIYIGTKNGFVPEFFKLVGLLFAIFITFHYYADLAKFLSTSTAMPVEFLEISCFSLLLSLVLFLFKLIREGMMIMLKVQAHPILDRWGGLVLAIVRSLLVGSLVLVALQIVRIDYIDKNIDKSFLGSYLHDVSPNFYKVCYDGFIEKFFQNEKLNPAVFKLNSDQAKESW